MRGSQICVPDHTSLKQKIMYKIHAAPYSGHLGTGKTERNISEDYWWPGMQKDIIHYVKVCPTCQRNRKPTQKPAGELQSLQVPRDTWTSISMDFITSLPTTKRGKNSIMVVVDRKSTMVHLIATTNDVNAHVQGVVQGVAQLFQDRVFCLHGIPDDIVSDRDTNFTSAFWRELQKLLGTSLNLSTANHPQTDGHTERMNSVLEDELRQYIAPDQQNWELLLSMAEFSMNNCYKSSIQCTPFHLVYGKSPATPATKHLLTEIAERNPTAHVRASQIHAALDHAKECMLADQSRDKAHADRKSRPPDFEIGQRVLFSTKDMRRGKSELTAKLLPRFIGPFKIFKRIGEQAYELELPPTMKIHDIHDVFHVSLLRPYHEGRTYQPPPVTILLDGEEESEVDTILDARTDAGPRSKKSYLVRWAGYGPEHDTWEPESNLQNCKNKSQACTGRKAT